MISFTRTCLFSQYPLHVHVSNTRVHHQDNSVTSTGMVQYMSTRMGSKHVRVKDIMKIKV
jgi:hypothetical protein